MAGEQLARFLKDLKTKESEITDLVYGTVTSMSPITVRREDGLSIPSNFIEVSQVAKGLYVRVDNRDYTVLRGIQAGDRVRMLQAQKSQVYFILERV